MAQVSPPRCRTRWAWRYASRRPALKPSLAW